MDNLLKLFNSVLPLSEEEENLIKEHFKIENFSRKDSYNQIGKICTKLGFVKEGVFKVSGFKAEGEEYIKYFVDEGHFVIDLNSFFYKTPSTESIVALTKCMILTINYSSYELLDERVPNFSKIIDHLKQKAILAKFTIKNEMLVDNASTKYRKFIERHPNINQRISQRDIALHLGISEYTLSRVRGQK